MVTPYARVVVGGCVKVPNSWDWAVIKLQAYMVELGWNGGRMINEYDY